MVASDAARRTASLILEALSGIRTTQGAADALGVALPRYYVLETRALAGLVGALEPRSRGRQRGSAEQIAALEGEVQRLERELRRFQALQRASQRALGLVGGATAQRGPRSTTRDTKAPSGAPPKRKRRPNRATRAERVAKGLVRGLAASEPLAEVTHADPTAGVKP